ncbi:MAG: type II toxin-antitoxin system VapC family toxin [Deltaproteobacteria bacterium]|nr:type II toxin-antitoxin system VapC family toxin [Deltaproteobacteria bacterium]
MQTDTPFYFEAIHRFQELALAYSLTAYDAAYLELALRKGFPLATFDQRLKPAARKVDWTRSPIDRETDDTAVIIICCQAKK